MMAMNPLGGVAMALAGVAAIVGAVKLLNAQTSQFFTLPEAPPAATSASQSPHMSAVRTKSLFQKPTTTTDATTTTTTSTTPKPTVVVNQNIMVYAKDANAVAIEAARALKNKLPLGLKNTADAVAGAMSGAGVAGLGGAKGVPHGALSEAKLARFA
jgi:hypothetical protein